MQQSKIYKLIDSEDWSYLFSKLPIEQQDIYFMPEYYRLYENNGDGRAHCFVFEKDDEIALYPFLINSVNNLGYDLDNQYYDIQGAYGYNGVVTSTYDDQFINKFYFSFNEYCKNENIIAEFTRFHPLIGNKLFSENNLQVIFDRKIVWLDLCNSHEKIFSNFQTTTRKQIKRATKRYNLDVKVFENDISILDDFIYIYHESMIRVQSTPYLYFNKLYFKSLIENAPSTCFLAYHESIPVACILAFYNNFYINGHLGGTLKDYLQVSPFSLLYNEMIKYGQKKGCRYLNVGGGATIKPDDSLLIFKLNFSKTTSDFFIGKKIHNPQIYNEVIKQWESKYPEKADTYKNLLLKYRY